MTEEAVFVPGSVYEWEMADWTAEAGTHYDLFVSGSLIIDFTEVDPVGVQPAHVVEQQN